MKQKKMSFFIRVKNAIINFEEYRTFAEEKVFTAIKYFLKLILIFSIIIMFALSYKVSNQVTNAIRIFNEECPNFRIENNILIIDDENKQFFKGDENGYISFLINSEKENLNEVEETANYQIVVAALKNKIVVKNYENIQSSITYEELSNKYDINNTNKDTVMDFITGENINKLFMTFIVTGTIYLYIAYLLQIIVDVLILSLVGYLFSKIIGIKFKYKSIFNMSIYALTLSIILYMIFTCINLTTGFTINYFEIAYNAIAYIYIATAMLMMKSDLIKQQIEVGKIVEEQKKIREEEQKKKEEEQEKKREEKDKDKEEEQKKEKNDREKKNDKNKGEDETPEGSKA